MPESRIAVSADHVCPRFDRAPYSLIEEPEVCENCARYEDGYCLAETETHDLH